MERKDPLLKQLPPSSSNPVAAFSRIWKLLFNIYIYIYIYIIDYAITVSHVSPLYSPLPCTPFPPTSPPPLSSCLWVLCISSLASTLPILFLTSPCLFSLYRLCYLFSVPFPPISLSHSPTDNSPCDLHFCDSVPVLVVCLVCFCFRFG